MSQVSECDTQIMSEAALCRDDIDELEVFRWARNEGNRGAFIQAIKDTKSGMKKGMAIIC